MGWMEGLFSGLLEEHHRVEDQNRQDARDAAVREGNLYHTLLGSDDPHAQALGLSGMVDMMNPKRRKGGFAGWMGEMEQSPTYQRIRQYLDTPQTKTITEDVPTGQTTLPSAQGAGVARLPEARPSPGVATEIPEPQPSQGAAAQPTGSPVTGTAANMPPPTMQWNASMPEPLTMRQTRTVTGPRQVFLTPMEKVEQTARMKVRGGLLEQDEELRQLGASEDEIKKARLAKLQGLRAGVGLHSVQGEMPDGKGGFTTVFANFNPGTGLYTHPGTGEALEGFRPRTMTASVTLGADREALSRVMFGKRYVELDQNSQASVERAIQVRKNTLTVGQALTHAATLLPNGTKEDQFRLAEALRSGSSAADVTGVASPVSTPGVTPSTVPAEPAATAPPTPGSAASPSTPVAGGAPSPTAATAPPTSASGKGGLLASLPTDLAGQTKGSGNPKLAGEIADAQAMNGLIDQATAALEPFKNDNTLQGALNVAKSYREGFFDPVTSIASQLADLAGLRQANLKSLGAGGTRALQAFYARRQHTPKLPSYRQVNSPFSAGITQKISGWLKDDAGTFESPQAWYQKLQSLKQVNAEYIRELEAAGGKSAGTPAPAATAPPGTQNAAAPAGGAYKDADGVWRVR